MSAKPQLKEIAEEELFERKFNFKSEKAGATIKHNQISRNLGGLLWQHFKGKIVVNPLQVIWQSR